MEIEREWPHKPWPLPAATALACDAGLLRERAQKVMNDLVQRAGSARLRKTLVKNPRYAAAWAANEMAEAFFWAYVNREYDNRMLTDSRVLRMWHARVHHCTAYLDDPTIPPLEWTPGRLVMEPSRFDPWWWKEQNRD